MSKTNIKMGKPTYIVKKDAGIIVCQITASGCDDKFPRLDLWSVELSRKLQKKFGIGTIAKEQIFTAVTKLHKGDTWNEITGKRIAESKCKRNIYGFYFKLYDFIINEILYKDIAAFNQYTDNLMGCAIKEGKHLKQLVNGIEEISNS